MGLQGPIVFIPHNSYHTYNLWLISKELEILGHKCEFLNIDAFHDEGVSKMAQKLDLATTEYNPLFFLKKKPLGLVSMNDWGAATKWSHLACNSLGIPNFSLVEGVQDFNDDQLQGTQTIKRRYPYSRASYILATGHDDLRYLRKEQSGIVGIARFEELSKLRDEFKRARPQSPRVLINLNFSYGVAARSSKAWLRQAIQSCQEQGLEFIISKHIADQTETEGLPVSDLPFLDELKKSTLLISRFSTCILESLIVDRPVIYFNNFDEKVPKFHEPEGAFPIATSLDQLKKSLLEVVGNEAQYRVNFPKFLEKHVSIDPQASSAKRAAHFISERLEEKSKGVYSFLSELSKEALRQMEIYHHFS